MLGLRELQEEFWRAITRPHGTPVPARLADHVRASTRLTPAERVDVYAHMYCARLVDTLGEDFPTVVAIVGADAFDALAHDYIARHPSAHPSLRHVGDQLVDFLEGAAAAGDVPAFLPDVARLDRARLDVFDAPDGALLRRDDLTALPAERWGSLRLGLGPWVRVLKLGWPAHAIWSAVKAGAAPEPWSPEPACVRVWRRGFAIYQAPMDERETAAVEVPAVGGPFAAVCERLVTVVPEDEAAREAGALLLRWIEDGLLERSDRTDQERATSS